MPKLSVIIPVYNSEKYIADTVKSVTAQTFADFELLLIDDGSTDLSGAVCDEAAKSDARIKVLHTQNAGQGAARNVGISEAKGEYIAFVDGDDLLLPNMFESLFDALKNTQGGDFARCNFARFEGDAENITPSYEFENAVFESNDAICRALILPMIGAYKSQHSITPTACTAVFKADIIRENSIKFLSAQKYLSEDLIFNIDFLSRAQSGVCIKEALYLYRSNDASFSRAYYPTQFDRLLTLYNYLENNVKLKGVSESEYAARIDAKLLEYVSVCVRKAVQFLPYSEAKGQLKRFAENESVRAALDNPLPAAFGAPLKLCCALLKARLYAPLYAIVKAFTLLQKA